MSDPDKHRTVNGADGAPDPEDPGDGPGNGSRFGIRRPRTRAEERIAAINAELREIDWTPAGRTVKGMPEIGRAHV